MRAHMNSDASERYPLVRAADTLSRGWAAILGVWLVLLFVLLLPSLELKLFADDFHSWRTVARMADRPFLDLMLRTYNPEFYRPFEFALIRLNMEFMGEAPVFYRLAVVFGHLLTCLAVLLLCIRLGFGRVAATASAVFFGIHQTNAMAVLSNDAAGQVYTTFFGLLALAALLPQEGSIRVRHVVASTTLLALSLLWKDAGTGFVGAAFVVLAWDAYKRDRRGTLAAAAAIAAMFAAYLILRRAAGVVPPTFGYGSRYQLWAGWNLVTNPLLMLLSMLTPVGSTIVLLRLGNWPFVAATIASIAFVTAGLVIGVFTFSRRFPNHRPRLILLSILFVTLFYPDALMTHISELYTYKPATLFAVFLGIGVADIYHWVVVERRNLMALLLAALVGVLFACHALSIQHKEWLMEKNGNVADHILKKIRFLVPEIHEDTSIVLANLKEGPAPNYSVFYMEGVDLLGGPQVFELLYGIAPRGYLVVPPERVDAACRTLGGHCLTVLYDAGSVEAGYRDNLESAKAAGGSS